MGKFAISITKRESIVSRKYFKNDSSKIRHRTRAELLVQSCITQTVLTRKNVILHDLTRRISFKTNVFAILITNISNVIRTHQNSIRYSSTL